MNEEFMKLVQEHEREWGNNTYPDKPELMDIMKAKVVVFWRPVPRDKKPIDARPMITVHDDLNVLEDTLISQILRAGLSPVEKRFVCAFAGQRQLKIKSVKIIFDYVDSPEK
jgi:hypothetical protein